MSRNTSEIPKNELEVKIKEGLSKRAIGRFFNCSFGKIDNYVKKYSLQELFLTTQKNIEESKVCKECGTKKNMRIFNDNYYCEKHYKHLDRHGYIIESTSREPNKVSIYDNTLHIHCYNKNHEYVGNSEILSDHYDSYIKNKRWYIRNDGYTATSENGNKVMLHRYIYKTYSDNNYDGRIDHIDGNPLNNRLENLRPSTNQQNSFNTKLNSRNTTGYKGVYWDKIRNKYEASIGYNYKKILIGYFDDKEQARKAREATELELFGEYSYLNRPNKQGGIK